MTTEKSSDESYRLKEMVRSVGAELIREKLLQYIKELRQGIKFFLQFTVCQLYMLQHDGQQKLICYIDFM